MTFVCGECGERSARAGYCSNDGQAIVETDDPLIGREIGRYRIARLLAEGGMGRVYLGIQPAIGSRVAIKVLAEHAGDTGLLERFFAEARAVNLIRHENIANVLDMAKLDGGRPYIVMEYIEGATLASLVRAGGASLGGIVQVMSEVLSALGAAHAIGIVHRDLKPDNILVTNEGHAKVLDFGIAKLLPGISQQLSPRTRTGALLGTPAYMAPEQISGSGNIDARTDLYAAGIVLYEAVTGRVPFVGETLFDLMRMHLEAEPQAPSLLRPQLPPSFEQVILQALAKDPAHRFQSAAAMGQALQHASQELAPEEWRALSTRGGVITGGGRSAPTTTAAPTPQAATRVVPEGEARGRRVAWIAGAAGLAAIVAIVAVIASRGGDDEPVATSTPPPPTEPVQAPLEQPPVATTTTTEPAPAAPAAPAPQPSPTPAKTAPSTPTTTTTKNGVTYITTPPRKEISIRADYNPKRFDPVAYLPKARDLARRLVPDAKLTSFEFDPVFSDGHVDLTMDGRDREYEFRSEALSTRPANVPRNMPVERPCRIQVEVSPTKVTARLLTDDDCDARLVRDPKCRLAGVWKHALAKGTPRDFVARVGWLFDEKWFFDTDLGSDGRGEVSSFADVCP